MTTADPITTFTDAELARMTDRAYLDAAREYRDWYRLEDSRPSGPRDPNRPEYADWCAACAIQYASAQSASDYHAALVAQLNRRPSRGGIAGPWPDDEQDDTGAEA